MITSIRSRGEATPRLYFRDLKRLSDYFGQAEAAGPAAAEKPRIIYPGFVYRQNSSGLRANIITGAPLPKGDLGGTSPILTDFKAKLRDKTDLG